MFEFYLFLYESRAVTAFWRSSFNRMFIVSVLLWRLYLNCRWGGCGCHQPHMGNSDYTGVSSREAFASGCKGVPRPEDQKNVEVK